MRRVSSLLLLSGVLASLSGCGAAEVESEGSPPSPTSARSESVTRFSGDGEADEYRIESVIDYARNRSSYVEPTTGCRSISIGNVTYSELPRDAGLPEGKRWVKSTWDAGVGSEAAFEQAERENAASDGSTTTAILIGGPAEPPPYEYLDYLRAQSGELERLGEDEVRGVETTRYRIRLDSEELMRRHLEREGWKDANIERYLETTPQPEQLVELWVDDDGLARRIVNTSTYEAGGFGTQRSVTTTEYFDFGLEPAIEPPPVAEVVESGEWQQVEEERFREPTEDDDAAAPPFPQAFEPNVAPSCLH